MQIVSKGGRVFCRASVHYPAEIVKSMKKAGYKVKEVADQDSKKRGEKT